jgi:hypothetical protein
MAIQKKIRNLPGIWVAAKGNLDRHPSALAATSLALLYGLVYFSRVGQLGLYVDDWDHVAQVAFTPFNQYVRAWPFDYRPFEALPWLLLYHVFGVHLSGYYCLLFTVEYATSLTLFLVARRLIGDTSIALACASLWSVYPSDPSVFWLTTFAYRFGALFFLLAMLLLLRAPHSFPRNAYWMAVLCAGLCLLSNELFLGFVVMLPILAVRTVRRLGPEL